VENTHTTPQKSTVQLVAMEDPKDLEDTAGKTKKSEEID
jgi:hypothetical protein